MDKETVLILLLLKPMTKTSQLNNIAIMIYHGGYPVLIFFFCRYFDENRMKDMKIKKRTCFIIETNNKNKSAKWKIKGDVFRRVLSPK